MAAMSSVAESWAADVRLRVFAPIRKEVDEEVGRVAVQAVGGAFTMLPRHLDTVAVLEPGLLSFVLTDGSEVFVAVEGGTLVKVGGDVLVSTPEAVRGPGLAELRHIVEATFLARAEHEEAARLAMARLEADVIERLVEVEEHEPR
jgi:F-type H+-transporting ATPase subunit epsilon